MAQTLAQKAKIKTAKAGVRDPLRDLLTAEAVLLDAKIAASPAIARLIKDAEDPGPHRIRLASDSVALYTFRKGGEYLGDAAGNPVKADEDGKLPEGAKAFPFYDVKITDLSEDEDD